MDAIKARGEWSNVSFSSDRAFKYKPFPVRAGLVPKQRTSHPKPSGIGCDGWRRQYSL